MRPYSAGIAIWCLLSPLRSLAAEPPRAVVVSKPVVELRSASDRLFRHSKSPFAVIVFPDDALGYHIGIIYYQPMPSPNEGAWSLDDRFWEAEEWASDATSFAWANDGSTLYVATDEVYGTGCVYRLDLPQRRAERIFPSATQISKYRSSSKGFTSTILAMDERKRVLTVRLTTGEGTNEFLVKLPGRPRSHR